MHLWRAMDDVARFSQNVADQRYQSGAFHTRCVSSAVTAAPPSCATDVTEVESNDGCNETSDSAIHWENLSSQKDGLAGHHPWGCARDIGVTIDHTPLGWSVSVSGLSDDGSSGDDGDDLDVAIDRTEDGGWCVSLVGLQTPAQSGVLVNTCQSDLSSGDSLASDDSLER